MEIPPRAGSVKSAQLFLALSRYGELFIGRAVLSCLEGELHHHSSHVHQRHWDPKAGWESVQLIQKSWRLTICCHLVLFMTHPEAWQSKPYRFTLAAADLTFCFSQRVCESEVLYSHCGLGTYGLGTYLKPVAQFLLPGCVKSSFRTGFYLVF